LEVRPSFAAEDEATRTFLDALLMRRENFRFPHPGFASHRKRSRHREVTVGLSQAEIGLGRQVRA